MNHSVEPTFQVLQYYATATYPCSYLPDRMARSQVAAPTHLIDDERYSSLVLQGFRRSGLFVYRPHCDACRACLPIRVDVANHLRSRTQRKVWRKHAHLQVRVLPLAWHDEHFALYERYQACRHSDGGADNPGAMAEQYAQFLLASRVTSRLLEFRDPVDQALQMVCVVDYLADGMSAVYTFFDPDTSGSLGVYGVLWQLAQCRTLGLPWLYLGYWIADSAKVSYKTQYRPYQLRRDGVWQTVSVSAPASLDA